jgi:hypothetical protein
MPDMKTAFARASEESQQGPIPMDDEIIQELYDALFGPSMSSQIVDQYKGYQQQSNLQAMLGGQPATESPMVRTIQQLDR